jgi:hypothetical protein
VAASASDANVSAAGGESGAVSAAVAGVAGAPTAELVVDDEEVDDPATAAIVIAAMPAPPKKPGFALPTLMLPTLPAVTPLALVAPKSALVALASPVPT